MTVGDGFDVRSLAATYRAGHRLPAHAHRWSQLIYSLSGVVHVSAGLRLWLTPPTRAIWIPAGVEHALDFHGECSLRTLYVNPERAGRIESAVKALEVTPLLRELIVHVVSTGMLDSRRPEHDRLAGVLVDLVFQAREIDLMLPLPLDPRAIKLAHQLLAAPGDRQALETLIISTGASLRTLQRCFAEETGMTIEAWRQKARLVFSAREGA